MASISAAVFGQQSAAKDGKTSCTPQTRITRTTVTADPGTKVVGGTVLDPNRIGIPQARVSVQNTVTKEIISTVTNEGGRFEFASLPVGDYSITIDGMGYKTLVLSDITVETDMLINLETILEITAEPLSGVVTIVEQVKTPPPGTTIISGDIIRRLPF
jgi:hypothetical protein